MLVKLPSEIRCLVWQILYGLNSEDNIPAIRFKRLSKKRPSEAVRPMLVCKLFYTEIVQMVFSGSVVAVYDGDKWHQTSTHARNYTASLRFVWVEPTMVYENWSVMKQWFLRLRVLEVAMSPRWYAEPGQWGANCWAPFLAHMAWNIQQLSSSSSSSSIQAHNLKRLRTFVHASAMEPDPDHTGIFERYRRRRDSITNVFRQTAIAGARMIDKDEIPDLPPNLERVDLHLQANDISLLEDISQQTFDGTWTWRAIDVVEAEVAPFRRTKDKDLLQPRRRRNCDAVEWTHSAIVDDDDDDDVDGAHQKSTNTKAPIPIPIPIPWGIYTSRLDDWFAVWKEWSLEDRQEEDTKRPEGSRSKVWNDDIYRRFVEYIHRA